MAAVYMFDNGLCFSGRGSTERYKAYVKQCEERRMTETFRSAGEKLSQTPIKGELAAICEHIRQHTPR